MDDEKTLKQIIREELQKLSKLTWGERIGYIWDYYKPLLAAILGVIFVISIAVTIYQNMQLNYLLNVYFLDCNSLEVDSDQMITEFGDRIGGLEKNDVVLVDTTVFLSDMDTQYGMANQMKLTAMVSAGEVDIMVLNEEKFKEFIELGYFSDLSTILPQELLDQWSDLLVTDEETGAVLGMDLTESPVLTEQNAYPDTKVYGAVVSSAKRLDLCDDFFVYLMCEEQTESQTELQTENADSAAE